MTNKIQTKVIVKGRVQGVFYRDSTKNEADRLGVKGYVKNLVNGSVEAVFEGETTDVTHMIEWCYKGPSASRVDHVQIQETALISNFQTFEIRY